MIRATGEIAATGDNPVVVLFPNGIASFAPWNYYVEATHIHVERGGIDTLEFIQIDEYINRPKRPQQRPNLN